MPTIYNVLFVSLCYFFILWVIGKTSLKNKTRAFNNTLENLDGFRGVLALLVYIHHSVIAYRYYFVDGIWALPDNRILGLIGQFSVSGFFCLTGFLFWRKLLNQGDIDAVSFYHGRINRILPAYLFSVFLLSILICVRSDFSLFVPLSDFARQIFSWLLLGVNGSPDVNGIQKTGVMNAYVFWTLKYEFYFYLALPLLSLFLRPLKYICLVVMVIIFFTWYIKDYVVLYFIVGSAIAYIKLRSTIVNHIRGMAGSLFLTGFLLAYFAFCNTAYDWVGVFMSIPIMFLILNGNDLFGFLNKSYIRLAGMISYSVYLLHGMALYISYGLFSNEINYIYVVLVSTGILIPASLFSFLKIESPFMKLKYRSEK
ncbi:MAG: acyltransferase [Plesiomonas sp.]|nr:acyltransferase [Plesiomonas sp.]